MNLWCSGKVCRRGKITFARSWVRLTTAQNNIFAQAYFGNEAPGGLIRPPSDTRGGLICLTPSIEHGTSMEHAFAAIPR